MTFSTYNQYIESNKSEKVILAHVHATKRLYNFDLDNGKYSRQVDNFVNKVKIGSLELTKVNSEVDLIDSTMFYYDIEASKLWLFDFDQYTTEVIVEYRLFLSNVPINLSWDLQDASTQVEYVARIIETPNFKSTMSQGKKGISLVGSGNIKINNNDGFYDGVYDTVFFENKSVAIYAFNRDLAPSEAKKLFRGYITSKSFSAQSITLGVNDSLYALEELVPALQYDNEVNKSDASRYKRTIYGKAANVLCQSIDQHGDGIAITGYLKGVKGQDFITGVGTNFLAELSEGDTLIMDGFSVDVDQVKSNNLIVVAKLDRTFDNQYPLLKPSIQYRNKNRTFQLSSHALKKVSSTITNIVSRNRIDLADASSFVAGDTIIISGTETKVIRRVSGNSIVLQTNYNLIHSIAATVSKLELNNVRYGKDSILIQDKNITIDNATGHCKFTIDSDAEINSAKFVRIQENFSLFNGRRTVWLGTPAIYNITTVDNTSGSLYGKYFMLYSPDGKSTAFWFKDMVPLGASTILEPTHGANSSQEIDLPSPNMTSSEVASICLQFVLQELDFFQGNVSSNIFTLETKESYPLTSPAIGTTGFSNSVISVGVASVVDIDLTKLINPRDYIKNSEAGDLQRYEVLSVQTKSITLRVNYNESNVTKTYINYKNVEYINDNTKIYVDCYGKTKDGTPLGDLIETGPEVAYDILKSSGLSDALDVSAFTNASNRASSLISMVLPKSAGAKMPKIKDAIQKINQSIMGSLFLTTDLNIGYDILDSEVPMNTLSTITDNDLIDWDVKSDSFDLNKITVGNYKFTDIDPNTNEEGNSQLTFISDFVDKYIGNNTTNVVDLFLYNEDQTQESIERLGFINSLGNSTIIVKGKLNLSKYRLGERVLLDLNRLYIALGSNNNAKRVGVITSIINTGEKVTIEIEDVGSIYTRASRITEDSADEFSASTSEEKVLNSFITDDNDIIGTDESTYATNLIS